MRIIETCMKAYLFPVKTLKNRVITFFQFSSMFPLEPASHLHILFKLTIYSVKDLLAQEGNIL